MALIFTDALILCSKGWSSFSGFDDDEDDGFSLGYFCCLNFAIYSYYNVVLCDLFFFFNSSRS